MSQNPDGSYEFGPFRLDARERRLLREGQAVPLPPKAFDLLLRLVRHHGHLLGKDELLKLVWPDMFVEEANLWRTPVEGGEEVEVLPGISDWSTFAPVARGIYFIPSRGPTAPASIQFLSFLDGRIKTIIGIAKPVFVGLTVSPDGKSLLYTQIDQEVSDLMVVERFR